MSEMGIGIGFLGPAKMLCDWNSPSMNWTDSRCGMSQEAGKGQFGKLDLVVAFAFFLVVVGSKVTVLNLPYHWDEIGYVVPIHWLAEGSLARAIPGAHPPHAFFGHPPGLFLSLAFLYRICGETIWLSHLVGVTFAFLGVFFTYLLTAHLFDRVTGIIAACFLFGSPVYFTQSAMALPDVPVTALGVMCIYFFFKGQPIAYLFSALYLVSLKETSLAHIFSIVMYLVLFERKQPRFWGTLSRYGTPLLVTPVFFALEKITTGQFLTNPYFEEHSAFSFAPGHVLAQSAEVLDWMFISQQRWALTVAILLCFTFQRRVAWRKEFLLFFLVSGCFVAAFSFLYRLPRYLLPTFPFLCLLAAGSLSSLVRNGKWRACISAAVLALFAASLLGSGKYPVNFSEDMQYVDVVRTYKETALYIEKNLAGRTVLAPWPLSDAFSFPYLGYVKHPIQVVTEPTLADVVVSIPQAGPADEQVKRIFKPGDLVLAKRFERDGKIAEVYVRKASNGRGRKPGIELYFEYDRCGNTRKGD
jgi:Dolichyl-phosphate-mannose-protein mannosyltransferase